MKNILLEPYPQRERTLAETLLHSAMEGLFVYAFLVILQPFGIKEWHHPNKYAIILLHGVVVTISVFVLRAIVPLLFPSFCDEKNWVIWKEIVTSIFLLGLISLGIIAVNVFVIGASQADFFSTFLSVMVIGFFPITFWIMSDYILKLKKYTQESQLSHVLTEFKNENLNIWAENKKDSYSYKLDQVCFINADDNYCTVHYIEDAKVKSQLIRTSLLKIESQISNGELTRIHKSYMVNMTRVFKIGGNAQGYKVSIEGVIEPIPIGRKYNNVIKSIPK